MKIIWLATLFLFLAPCSFAQPGKMAVTGARNIAREVDRVVAKGARQMAKQTRNRAPVIRLAQLVSIPQSPTLKFRFELSRPIIQKKMMSVQLLPPLNMRQIVFPENGIYVPEAIDTDDWLLFRGMKLHSLAEIENLMRAGLEQNKSHYTGKIHTTPALNIALGHSFPSRYSDVEEDGEKIIPVLVTIPYTGALEKETSFYMDGFQYVFESDIPAKHIGDVWVFWSVNRKPGWYKVTFEKGELIFVPAPAKLQEFMRGN